MKHSWIIRRFVGMGMGIGIASAFMGYTAH
jgi:hypothetical protein